MKKKIVQIGRGEELLDTYSSWAYSHWSGLLSKSGRSLQSLDGSFNNKWKAAPAIDALLFSLILFCVTCYSTSSSPPLCRLLHEHQQPFFALLATAGAGAGAVEMISDMGFEPIDQSSVAGETENQSKEIGKVLCSDVGAAEIDHNYSTASFLSPLDTKDCSNKNNSGFDDDRLVNSRSQEQIADIRLDKLKPGSFLPSVKCSSSPEAASYVKDHENCGFLKSSCNDETISMVSDVDESMNKRSPSSSIADDDASSDGPSSANFFSGCNMVDGRMEIDFYADYINYRGVHYVDSTVTFSRSSVIVKSKTINGNPGTFHIQLEIEDIIKIESQWSARYELGLISVHFVSNSAVGDETVDNTSGIQELYFPAVDSNWYEKQEAIESLNMRYKELWKVRLDIEREDCTEATHEGKAMQQSRSYFPNYHWSLIVICYFGKVVDYEDVDANKLARVPCILHMDSIKGSHAGLKDLMQSYLWEEWKERQKETHEDLYSKFRNLKFISLELPQQQNSFDCGLFLLHYVELFLEEVPADFNIHKITSLSNFLTADWFPPGEASIKRAHIERLIYDLCENHSGGSSSSIGSDMHCYPNGSKTTNEYGNAEQLVSEKSVPTQDCHVSSLVGSGVEMTLLQTSSSRSTQCASNTGLVLREFFEPGSASGSFIDGHCQAFEHRSSLNELKRPISPIQEEMEANGHFVYTTPAEIAYPDITAEASIFPYPCGDFRLESVPHAALEDSDSSPADSVCDSDNLLEVKDDEKCLSVGEISLEDKIQEPRCVSPENVEHLPEFFGSASGKMPNAAESRCHDQTSEHNDNAHSIISFPNNLQEFYHQGNEFLSDGMGRECFADCPASASGEILLDASDSESPIRMLDQNDHVDALARSLKNSPQSSPHDDDIMLDDVDIGSESVMESDMQRAAKRMRLDPVTQEEELMSNLSKDDPPL
ncbi:unnamed protein product [Fraxinus pennsylvanica]|uniref:Ubiquitin-like protease family profile domain-containing protein n=1 Tax=Fraxinus pennsylvanica TaxID=56036 RepID=A0AAD1YTK9_9LAMI|nr:unnamed protein product [Fraxinus pennsylvanica]